MRARSTAAAVVVVALALLAGAALLLTLLQRNLISEVQQSGSDRAQEVAQQVADHGLQGLAVDLQAQAVEGHAVQVVDASGDVVASSSALTAAHPVSPLRPAPGTEQRGDLGRTGLLRGRGGALVVARGVRHGDSRYTVLVTTSVRAERETVRTVLSLLLVGVPLLLLLAGLATWVLVSRSLRPVERIRSRVATIGGTRLDERVPVPQSDDEIARLARTMNEMLDRVQQAQAAQRRFVSDASHELRSPLATLSATLEVAAADRTGTAWLDLSGVMSAETTRMGRLVEDLLLLARSDDAGLALRRGDVDLDDLVAEEAHRLRSHPASGVEVRAHPTPVRVEGDGPRLSQILRNLADNAVRHARSQVELGVREDGADAVLWVEDDGPGVPQADRARVFDRFVRLDDSRERGSGGSGLGLAIVRELVRLHGGTVAVVEPQRLGGARFEVRLPRSQVLPGLRPT